MWKREKEYCLRDCYQFIGITASYYSYLMLAALKLLYKNIYNEKSTLAITPV